MFSTYFVANIFAIFFGCAILRWFRLLKMLTQHNFRYHPDKNANDPKAADMFKEVTFSYNILYDPDKRRQYDTAGFEVRY
jgi:hypothetical protein